MSGAARENKKFYCYGATGPPGPPGPPGSPITTISNLPIKANYAYCGLMDLTNVAAGSAIPLYENFAMSGENISHIPPNNVIVLAPNHSYSVEYTVVANPPPTYGLSIVMRLDGIDIRGSRARSPETAIEIDGFVSSSGGAIFRTASVQSMLEFVVDSGTIPTLIDEFSVRIIQLD